MIKEIQHYNGENGVITKYSSSKRNITFFTVEKGNGDYLDFYENETDALYAMCDKSNTEGRVASIPNPWKTDETEELFWFICMVFEANCSIPSAISIVEEYYDLETGHRLVL